MMFERFLSGTARQVIVTVERAAWAGRSPGRIGTQLLLLTWAFLLERDHSPVGA